MDEQTDIQRLRKDLESYQKAASEKMQPFDETDQTAMGQIEMALAVREASAEIRTALDYLSSEVALWRSESAERGAYPLQVRVEK